LDLHVPHRSAKLVRSYRFFKYAAWHVPDSVRATQNQSREIKSRTSIVGNYHRIRRSRSFRKPLVWQRQVEPSSRQLWVRPSQTLGLRCPFVAASVVYLDTSLAHGWRRVEGAPSVELRLGGDDVEYGVEVGTHGAKLVCVEADLTLTECAALCQGFCLKDGDP
jgi:hypothetical protein